RFEFGACEFPVADPRLCHEGAAHGTVGRANRAEFFVEDDLCFDARNRRSDGSRALAGCVLIDKSSVELFVAIKIVFSFLCDVANEGMEGNWRALPAPGNHQVGTPGNPQAANPDYCLTALKPVISLRRRQRHDLISLVR